MRRRADLPNTAPPFNTDPSPPQQAALPLQQPAPAPALHPPDVVGGTTMPALPPPYQRIVTHVFDMPAPDEQFLRLRQELDLGTIKPSNASYGDVVDALDQAEKNAQAAVELLANFKVALAAFEMDALATRGPLRERAKERLAEIRREEFEANKAQMGSKASAGKQITEADVDAALASMFPDEARELDIRRAQAKGACDSAESLVYRWAERARDLREMVRTIRAP